MTTPIPNGLLVVIEGIDGAGKTTVASSLGILCEKNGIAHLLSKEPTAGFYGQQLRNSAQEGRLSLTEELELFRKDREEHVDSRIAPALAEGKVVILDRYYFSTAAYQGIRGADPAQIIAENERFAPQPDLLLILDVPSKLGLERIRKRGDIPNEFEREEMLDKSRDIFLSLDYPFRFVIDATQPVEKVIEDAKCHFLVTAADKVSKHLGVTPAALNLILQINGTAPIVAA